jgi:hypothetical protein
MVVLKRAGHLPSLGSARRAPCAPRLSTVVTLVGKEKMSTAGKLYPSGTASRPPATSSAHASKRLFEKVITLTFDIIIHLEGKFAWKPIHVD